MLIRFESFNRDVDARCNDGVFKAAGRLRDDWCDRQDLPWHIVELNRLIVWFDDNLEAPERLEYYHRRSIRGAICWFRDSAREHVDRARYMAFLVEDLGEPIIFRRTTCPGTILWQDEVQVAALAN